MDRDHEQTSKALRKLHEDGKAVETLWYNRQAGAVAAQPSFLLDAMVKDGILEATIDEGRLCYRFPKHEHGPFHVTRVEVRQNPRVLYGCDGCDCTWSADVDQGRPWPPLLHKEAR